MSKFNPEVAASHEGGAANGLPAGVISAKAATIEHQSRGSEHQVGGRS